MNTAWWCIKHSARRCIRRLFFSLTDIDGRLLRHSEHLCTSGRNELEMPLQNLPTGLYFLRISDETGEAVALRVLIEN